MKYMHLRWWVAGLSESRLHDLRHFMATQMLAAGVDPKVVAYWPFPGWDGGDIGHTWLIKACKQEKPCK